MSHEYYQEVLNLGQPPSWRWDGKVLETRESNDTWYNTTVFSDVADLNYGYEGSAYEAVRVDEQGHRVEE